MQPTSKALPHVEAPHVHHDDRSFLQKYVFSTDHKIIGIQYGVTGLSFLFFGFCLMALMRWQIAYPNRAVPVVGPLLETLLGQSAAGGKITSDLYNSFGA